ncbi:MAG: hypothetical protein AMXMBFR64_57650 [Myxococcales bacterium]
MARAARAASLALVHGAVLLGGAAMAVGVVGMLLLVTWGGGPWDGDVEDEER